MENKPKWVDTVVCWEGEKEGKKYLQISFNENMEFKKGDKLYLNENLFAHKNPKAPKFKKSRKVEDTSLDDDVKELKEDGLPF